MKFLTRALLLISVFFSFSTVYANLNEKLPELSPLQEHSQTTAEIVSRLRHQHYQRHHIGMNDALSSMVLDRYIESLDSEKSFFLASDIKEFEKYRYTLDDALRRGNVKPAYDIYNRFDERIDERYDYLIELLHKGIDKLDFTKDEYLVIDRKQVPWAKTKADLDDLWRRRLKNDVLNLRLAGKKDKDIEKLLDKRYENKLNQLSQTNSEDAYRVFMNSLTLSYDPHTQYFSPRATENFNIRMRLSLEGIGAMLQQDDEYTKITRLIPAGPADKSGKLKANDRIVGVGQGKDGEMVDVVGWRLDDVVDLIRGPKDTVVRLAVLDKNSIDNHRSHTVSITRDKVKLEDQAASKKILHTSNYGRDYKIGVIHIPKFYIDFDAASRGDPNYRSTTRDVHKLLDELKQDNVDGIIIDLRDNGGGSLREVNELIGLFIEDGPTVQVKNTNGRVYVHQDDDHEIAYRGPLAVLVNRLSASASEIFAGAIQDYRRGLVIGTQTYGKGTVQAMMPLNHGQITLTQQKFYRISGNSTQNRGVIPDISLPSLYDVSEIGESTLEQALPWDRIAAASYHKWDDFSRVIPRLQALHEKRAAHDPDFQYLVETNKLIEERRAIHRLSLNEAKRRAEKTKVEKSQLAIENERRKAKHEPLLKSIDELEDQNENEDADVEADKDQAPLLNASMNIMVDYINISHPQIARQ